MRQRVSSLTLSSPYSTIRNVRRFSSSSSAITSGGSQAMLFKINTFGEEAFLEKLEEAVRPFRV